MIKHINHQNFQTTPFVAAKHWRLFNIDSDALVILEPTGSEDTIALEFLDYTTNEPVLNTGCSIALEQQGNDRAIYQEGATGSGAFFPNSEPTNRDGTFKRLIHAQTKAAFYNKFQNPTQIFGVEYIDFPLGQTFRDLSDFIRIFTVPRNIFGERIIENTVHLADNSLDDNVEITDDGYQNLIAKSNLFSKVQEVRSFGNIIMSGSLTTECFAIEVNVSAFDSGSVSVGFLTGRLQGDNEQVSGEDSGSVSVGFYFGALEDVPIVENSFHSVAFNTGSLQIGIITSSFYQVDSGSFAMSFYTGSLIDQVVSSSTLADSGSTEMAFYTGSLFDLVITASGATGLEESGSTDIAFYTGSLFLEAVTASAVRTFESSSMNVGFSSGILS
jgi:hypothetical protein